MQDWTPAAHQRARAAAVGAAIVRRPPASPRDGRSQRPAEPASIRRRATDGQHARPSSDHIQYAQENVSVGVPERPRRTSKGRRPARPWEERSAASPTHRPGGRLGDGSRPSARFPGAAPTGVNRPARWRRPTFRRACADGFRDATRRAPRRRLRLRARIHRRTPARYLPAHLFSALSPTGARTAYGGGPRSGALHPHPSR